MLQKTEKHGGSSINVFKLENLWKIPKVRTYDTSYHKIDAIFHLRLAKSPLIKYPHYKSEANSEEKIRKYD